MVLKEKLNLVAFRRMLHFLFQKDFWRVNPELKMYSGYERVMAIQKYLIMHDCRFVRETYQSMILYKNCFVTTQFNNIGYLDDFENGDIPKDFCFKLHRLGPHGVKNSTFLLNHNKTLRYCFHYLMEFQEHKREHSRTKFNINKFLRKEKIEDFATDFYLDWFHKVSFENYFDLVHSARAKVIKVGCYHCKRIFDSKKIKVRSYSNVAQRLPEITILWSNDIVPTAVCPFCGVDSIIAETLDTPRLKVTPKLLEKLNEKYFKEENDFVRKNKKVF